MRDKFQDILRLYMLDDDCPAFAEHANVSAVLERGEAHQFRLFRGVAHTD